MSEFEEWLRRLEEMKHRDPDRSLPEHLVTRSDAARWLSPEVTGNPSRIGVLAEIPAQSMAFFLQEIPVGHATDLQRHAHESVHFVMDGEGHSEIGTALEQWADGDFVYTPPWVWHRHYNDGPTTVRMLLVENSPLLEHLGLNRRESAGTVGYQEHTTGAVSAKSVPRDS